MSTLTTTRTLVHLSRPWNWLRMQVPATLLGIFCGLYVLGVSWRDMRPNHEMLAALIAVAAISGGGYVINDYFDRDIDAVNEPGRPLPAGLVSGRTALLGAIGMFGIGLLVSFAIGYANVVIAALWILFAVGYAAVLKRKGYGLESITFGVIMGLTALFGSAAVLHRVSSSAALLLSGFMATYITAAHITGTLKDVRGDSAAGCKTIAVLLGEARTRLLIPAIYTASFAVLFLAAMFLHLRSVLLAALSGLVVLVLMFNVRLLKRDRKAVARALSISKTLLQAIFVVLIIQFCMGTPNHG